MATAAAEGYVRCQADRYLDDGDLKVSTAYSLNKKGRWKLTELLASELNDEMAYVTTICHSQQAKNSKVKIFSTKSSLLEAVDIPQMNLPQPCLSRRKDHRKVVEPMHLLANKPDPRRTSDITYNIYAHLTNPLLPYTALYTKDYFSEYVFDERKPRKSKHSQNALKFALEDFEDGERDANFDLWEQPEEKQPHEDEYVHIDNEDEQKTHHDRELDVEVIGDDVDFNCFNSPPQRNGSMLSDWLKVKSKKKKAKGKVMEHWEIMEDNGTKEHIEETRSDEVKDFADDENIEDDDGDWQLIDFET